MSAASHLRPGFSLSSTRYLSSSTNRSNPGVPSGPLQTYKQKEDQLGWMKMSSKWWHGKGCLHTCLFQLRWQILGGLRWWWYTSRRVYCFLDGHQIKSGYGEVLLLILNNKSLIFYLHQVVWDTVWCIWVPSKVLPELPVLLRAQILHPEELTW